MTILNMPPSARPTREQRRSEAADQLLTALENLVRRHRALELSTDELGLHAELIAAEVAHQLAVTRSALQRSPVIHRPA
ncbi:MAG: hypothetical protein QOH17_2356 [Pseudonocardiales bacterium]|jgi:hypothetical protein|nr:hypothetical protein [Pseudonocardiales bacterium]MDT7576023.1 hypothetical protein [Pseudonocardiales bacterium]